MCCKLNNNPLVSCVVVFRPLPSLDSPPQEFLTPSEEIDAPQEIPPPEQAAEKTAEIPPLNLLKQPEDLSHTSTDTAEPPEVTQQTVEHPEPTQSTKVELPEQTKNIELSAPIEKEEQPPEELLEPQRGPVGPSDVVEEAAELLEPAESTEKLPEPQRDDKPEPAKTSAEPREPEKKLIGEPPEEKPTAIPPEVPVHVPADGPTSQGPAEESLNSG